MKWAVMKAMHILPSDPRTREMNIYQWLWCYHNIVEDKKEEQELFKDQLDRLAFIINPDTAKKVFEYEEKNKTKKDKKKKGKEKPMYEKKDIYNSDVFDIETRAAMLGYDPSMGIDASEFLEKYKQDKKESDVLNGDIDSLIDEMDEVEEIEERTEFGDPDEDPDDFFTRALQFEEFTATEATMNIGADYSGDVKQNQADFADDELDIFEVDDE